jgi:hypothetical protein
MDLKIREKTVLFALGIAAVGLTPLAASAAMVTVVHGINGSDLAAAPSLPVDIAVNGSCAIKGLNFTQTTRVELGAGSYSVTVHPADGSCSKSPVISQNIAVPSSARYVGLVANLSDTGVPKLSAFVNDSEYPRSITVNNAAANAPFMAGSGQRNMIFYYGNPLQNGEGIMLRSEPRPRRISVVMGRLNRKRDFFKETFKVTKSRVFYVLGSKKSGLRVVSETLGE